MRKPSRKLFCQRRGLPTGKVHRHDFHLQMTNTEYAELLRLATLEHTSLNEQVRRLVMAGIAQRQRQRGSG